jgi:hypothetical protein
VQERLAGVCLLAWDALSAVFFSAAAPCAHSPRLRYARCTCAQGAHKTLALPLSIYLSIYLYTCAQGAHKTPHDAVRDAAVCARCTCVHGARV